MMLSIVFLLMFVASSLRSGSAGLQQQVEFKKLSQKAQDMEEQIRVYDTLKDEALRKQTSEAEQEVYRKLMGKLDLLKDETNQEKMALLQKAKANEEKEYALNQYQQIIRNIINTNVLAKSQISRRDQQIETKNATIEDKRQQIQQMEQVVAQNSAKISAINNELAAKIKALRKTQQSSRTSKAILEKQIAKLKAASENKRRELQASNEGISAELKQAQSTLAQTKEKLGEASGQLAGLSAKVSETESKLAGSEAEKKRALASVEGLQNDLARTKEIANARKALAQRISQQFAKAGLTGTVDPRTGEVTIDFEGEYFDTGSIDLKPKMRSILDKFMPVYTKSLFTDKKVAEKIASVEVVGFASSTYKGRYVNPKSSRPEDKDAIDYNLQLSFGRAKAIFKHVLNQGVLSTGERDQLMPMLKVVGRGYLPEGKTGNEFPVNMTEKEFCLKFNCKKAQKVIIKFNMKD